VGLRDDRNRSTAKDEGAGGRDEVAAKVKLDDVYPAAALPDVLDKTDPYQAPEAGAPKGSADRKDPFVWFRPGSRQSPEPAPHQFNSGAAANQRGTLHARDGPNPARDGSRAGEASDLQDS
jgi:hypothetical protein